MARDYRLALYDDEGMQVSEYDVSLGAVSKYGFSLINREGRDGLLTEIVLRMLEGDAKG